MYHGVLVAVIVKVVSILRNSRNITSMNDLIDATLPNDERPITLPGDIVRYASGDVPRFRPTTKRYGCLYPPGNIKREYQTRATFS